MKLRHAPVVGESDGLFDPVYFFFESSLDPVSFSTKKLRAPTTSVCFRDNNALLFFYDLRI